MPPKTSDKLEKEVRAIAKLPANKQCVDCGEKVRSGKRLCAPRGKRGN
jgi:hypothetical protein